MMKGESVMSVKSVEELEALKSVGRIVALALAEMARHVTPGVTTEDIDRIGALVLRQHGARSAPRLVYGFPAVV
jgi:methionyl aminopeptidase